MLPQHDNATAFAPAITALRLELADLERRAGETRSLIEALCARGGIAGSSAAAPGGTAVASSAAIKGQIEQAEAKKRQAAAGPASGKGKKTASGKLPQAVEGSKIGRSRENPPKGNRVVTKPNSPKTLAEQKIDKVAAKPDLTAAVADWQNVLTSRAEAIADAEGATRDKHPAKLNAAVAARARLERRLGEILTIIDGKIRPLPGVTDRNARERWKAFAKLSEPDFEAKLRRSQRGALSAIGVKPETPSTRPQQAMKISAWRVEPDGSRSRTVTAVDGAEAP